MCIMAGGPEGNYKHEGHLGKIMPSSMAAKIA
jgi:hypothetical protein